MLCSEEADRKVKVFQERIIEWYEANGEKNLPWRNTSDPWAILVAAFLLRKTTTKQVVKVYEHFLRRYPSPEALLRSSEDEVKDLIRPLGIEHQRAKDIISVARIIVEKFGGEAPRSKDKLKLLPGVGNYIASEVLLCAYGQPEPLLDRNMIRVIERVFGVKSKKKRSHTDNFMWSFARKLVPKDPASGKKFNYGVLDFARNVCTARNPRCGSCFIKDICLFYEGLTEQTLRSKP
ncbi:MAG: A/G-specific adenine glycosylase [Candidatus Freyarchaeota archaeon]